MPNTTTIATIAFRTTWRMSTVVREMPLIRAVSTKSILSVESMLARSVRVRIVEKASAIVSAGRNRCQRWSVKPSP